jgi:hypothetical protein
LTAIASSENRFSPTATHRHDHSDLRTPSQIQRVLVAPSRSGMQGAGRCCK